MFEKDHSLQMHSLDCEIIYSTTVTALSNALPMICSNCMWKLPSSDCKILPVTYEDVLFQVHNIITPFSVTQEW